MPNKRIILGVTIDDSLQFLKGFPEYLVSCGWDVHVISGPGPRLKQLAELEGVTTHSIGMKREPSPLHDLYALMKWIRIIHTTKPDLVSVGTPKAGLLGTISAFVVRVPTRIYLLRGLRLETENGIKRRVLWAAEWISARMATKVQSVSNSLREEFINLGLCTPEKIVVLGNGSSNGVELVQVAKLSVGTENSLCLQRGIPVVGFVGRLTEDKGLLTLLSAVRQVRENGSQIQVLLIGPEEPTGSLRSALSKSGLAKSDVTWIGVVTDVRPYYQRMDLLCLPTHREGFPNVVLEAAAQGIPAIVSNATGAVDSVIDGKTGWLFEMGDSNDLANKLQLAIGSPAQRNQTGRLAREHVTDNFERTIVWAQTLEFFRHETGLSNRKEELI